MSHSDEFYEEHYSDLIKQANIISYEKKENFINKNMEELGISYKEALLNYEQDLKNHAKILNSW